MLFRNMISTTARRAVVPHRLMMQNGLNQPPSKRSPAVYCQLKRKASDSIAGDKQSETWPCGTKTAQKTRAFMNAKTWTAV